MQSRLRDRSRTDRLALIDEEEDQQAHSPSYFEWQERTSRTKAFKPVPKAEPKVNSIVRLFRLFS